eukprot:scaffold269997_cov34-Tisochrysis_lutea.AAC.2
MGPIRNKQHTQFYLKSPSLSESSTSNPRIASPRETRGAGAVFEDCATPDTEAFHKDTTNAPISRSCGIIT